MALVKLCTAGRGRDGVIMGVHGVLPAIMVWGEGVAELWIGLRILNNGFKHDKCVRYS